MKKLAFMILSLCLFLNINGQTTENDINIDSLLSKLGKENSKSTIFGDEIRTRDGFTNAWDLYKPAKEHRTKWEKGFLVNNNDTIKGEFKLSDSAGNLIHVYYRKDSLMKGMKIRADKFDFMLKGQSIYISKNLKDFPEFIRVMENGSISLYAKETKGNGQMTYGGIIVDYYLEKGDKIIGPITNLGFWKISEFFNEYPELFEKIKKDELTFYQIREIVQIYNLKMSQKETE
ncbi:MAG: hypothetical protein M0P66_16220 [Salinivirgaceae bacterium]|nr:hypothetical protein [Salinivirgaceae bacterium]